MGYVCVTPSIKNPVSGFCNCAHIIPIQLVLNCVGSQGNWRSVGGSGIRLVRVRVCVCPCVPAAFVFLSQFSIPALRGECFL